MEKNDDELQNRLQNLFTCYFTVIPNNMCNTEFNLNFDEDTLFLPIAIYSNEITLIGTF